MKSCERELEIGWAPIGKTWGGGGAEGADRSNALNPQPDSCPSVWTVGCEPGDGPPPKERTPAALDPKTSAFLNPTSQAKSRKLGFELTLLFCKCEFYKALYN
jgi:hypothetical protein